MYSYTGGVQANPADHCSNSEDDEVEDSQSGFPPVAEPPTLVDVEPENTAEAIREPRCEQRRDER